MLQNAFVQAAPDGHQLDRRRNPLQRAAAQGLCVAHFLPRAAEQHLDAVTARIQAGFELGPLFAVSQNDIRQVGKTALPEGAEQQVAIFRKQMVRFRIRMSAKPLRFSHPGGVRNRHAQPRLAADFVVPGGKNPRAVCLPAVPEDHHPAAHQIDLRVRFQEG